MTKFRTAGARNIVLVDGENFGAKHIETLLDHARALGSIVEVRVYGHFATMNGWQTAIDRLGLTKVDVAVKGANSTDFQLTVDAMDILHMRSLDGFCIAASDAGYSALARRIRTTAVRVFGFGDERATEEYRKLFNAFVDVSDANARRSQIDQPTEATPQVKRPLPIPDMKGTIQRLKRANGWSLQSDFGRYHRPGEYGYRNVTTLVSEGLKGHVESNREVQGEIRVCD